MPSPCLYFYYLCHAPGVIVMSELHVHEYYILETTKVKLVTYQNQSTSGVPQSLVLGIFIFRSYQLWHSFSLQQCYFLLVHVVCLCLYIILQLVYWT